MTRRIIKISALFLSVLLFLSLMPTMAFAAGPIDTDQPVKLTISYKDGTKAISGAHFSLYKVADVDEYARMTLTSQFDSYKNTVSSLSNLDNLTQEQWHGLASTLKGYVQRDAISVTAQGNTNKEGNLVFSDLRVGLYLVLGGSVTTSDYYTYTAVPFMIYLPGEDTDNNDWDYEVEAAPKYTKNYTPHFITRKVIKEWDDKGYESIRPKEVIVQLLKDGKLYETQTLNKDNNWRYTWDKLDSDCEWDVVEKEIEGYAVSKTLTGITFTITNKYIVPIIGTDLPIQKSVTGDKPSTNCVFVFTFSGKDVNCPMPSGSTGTVKEVVITGAGSQKIGEITFSKPGTYVYTVSEKNGGVEGYTYDSTVYTVTFEVTEKNGELSVTKTIKDNKGNTATAIVFTNNYKTPGNKLPQTGVLWWPVPVLVCVGLVSVMVGIIRRRKYN